MFITSNGHLPSGYRSPECNNKRREDWTLFDKQEYITSCIYLFLNKWPLHGDSCSYIESLNTIIHFLKKNPEVVVTDFDMQLLLHSNPGCPESMKKKIDDIRNRLQWGSRGAMYMKYLEIYDIYEKRRIRVNE